MGPSSPTYDVGTPTSDNEIQSMKGNEDSFGFNLDQSGCGQVPIIPLSGNENDSAVNSDTDIKETQKRVSRDPRLNKKTNSVQKISDPRTPLAPQGGSELKNWKKAMSAKYDESVQEQQNCQIQTQNCQIQPKKCEIQTQDCQIQTFPFSIG